MLFNKVAFKVIVCFNSGHADWKVAFHMTNSCLLEYPELHAKEDQSICLFPLAGRMLVFALVAECREQSYN